MTMNKKIFFLVLIQICFFTTRSFAQTARCVGATNTCIADQQVQSGLDWFTSHGTVTFPTNNAPTSPSSTHCIRLLSAMNQGSGAFTCYRFDKNQTYRVCFWVRNVSGWPSNPFGRLYVRAAKDLMDNPGSSPNLPGYSYTSQLIDQSYYGPPPGFVHPSTGASDWEFVSFKFTAKHDFTQLWFYPLNPNGPPPPGPPQHSIYYQVEIDDIRVTQEPASSPAITILDNLNGNPMAGCGGSVSMTPQNMPPNTVAFWDPPVDQANPTGRNVTVTAKPCSTTTYKMTVVDTNQFACGGCTRQVVYHTVNVTPWANVANISFPATVPCTGQIPLAYNPSSPCAQIGFNDYTWMDPQGNTYTGRTYTVLNANAYQTGEWTLSIYNSVKGCSEELKFNITVGSCCVSNPDFTVSGCNPVTFTNTSTGLTFHKNTLWDFGDGTTSGLMNPIHTYNNITASPDSVIVCLTMLYEDGQGENCCNRKCKYVQVCPGNGGCVVNADFTINPTPGINNTFDFTDASSGNGTICDYIWNFGDGTILHTTIPIQQHHFVTPGPWNVCLTAINCVYDAGGNVIARCTSQKCYVVYPVTSVTKPHPDGPGAQLPPAIDPSLPLSVEAANTNALSIYPNPNHGSFSLALYRRSGNYRVIVRDQLGRDVYHREHNLNKAPLRIELGNIEDGIYSVEVSNAYEKFSQQISVIK